jgi:caspase domain-containing protein
MSRWLLAGLAMVLALLPLTVPAQKPRVERPTYAVGDTWVLSDATYRLARLTRDAYVFTAAGDREIWLTRDLAITYVKQGSETLEIQEPPRLSWPLEAGKRGVGLAIIRAAGVSIEVYANWRVEVAERVTVAGGAFDALRVRYTFDPEIPGRFGSQSATQRYGPAARDAAFEVAWWYAPQVQRIVKATSSKALLNFELGGGAPPAIAQAPAAPPPAAETPRPAPRPPTAGAPAQPPAAPAAPPVAAPEPPPATVTRTAYAVVIGVGRYEHLGIPTLKYAVADAEAVYKVLIETVGFTKDNVLLLTDRTERKPTLRNIKYALGTFLARVALKDDTVIVYFAGHGAPEVDQRGLERDGLAKYLIPSDADPDDLYSSALPMDDLQTIFGRIEAERVVMFLDACYSGAAGGRTFASKKTRSGAVDDLFLERLTRSRGRAIVTASRPAEVSIELPELGHGIFTYYLTEGLRGAGDLNRDGIVSLQELYEYVEQQVVRKSRAVGGNQHPVMKGELEGVLPLVKVRRR